jgi:hypothetical protein
MEAKRPGLFLRRAARAAALCRPSVTFYAGMPLKVVSVFGHASVAIRGYMYRHVRVQTDPGRR